MQVHTSETATNVLSRALEQLAIAVSILRMYKERGREERKGERERERERNREGGGRLIVDYMHPCSLFRLLTATVKCG